jgi:hypothetical protein
MDSMVNIMECTHEEKKSQIHKDDAAVSEESKNMS